jgi:hypothetical protein
MPRSFKPNRGVPMTEVQTRNEKFALRRLAKKCALEISITADRGRLMRSTPDGHRVPVLAGELPALRRYLDTVAADKRV